MTEKHYWPFVEMRRVANGWIVEPGRGFNRDTLSVLEDIHVFETWEECAKFLLDVTSAKSAG